MPSIGRKKLCVTNVLIALFRVLGIFIPDGALDVGDELNWNDIINDFNEQQKGLLQLPENLRIEENVLSLNLVN